MASPLSHARRGAVLAILAALLLANPLYLGLFVEEPRPRSPTGYAATAVDPSTPDGQRTIIRALGSDDILDVDSLREANRYSPYGPRYRGPDGAVRALERARENGSARVSNETVGFTLGRVAASYEFVVFPEDADGDSDGEVTYYRLEAYQAADGSTVVTIDETTREAVARYILHQDAVLYSSLPRYQRESVENVLDAGQSGYRPYNDEFVDLTDNVVVTDDSYYVFSATMHVDDFGPSARDLGGGLLYLLGFLALLVAAVSTWLSIRGD